MLYKDNLMPVSNLIPKAIEHITLSTEIAGHSHDYLQVVIGLQGKIEFDINGMGNRLNSGQGCIVTPESDHAFGGIDQPSDILVLNLIPDSESNYFAMSEIQELALDDSYFKLNAHSTLLIKMLAQEVKASPDNILLCQACNHTIVALLKKHASAFNNQLRMGRLDIAAVDNYIAKHIQNKISITQLAGSVFLSESQFHKQFKKQTNSTPHQYILKHRVEYAKELIEKNSNNLNYISDMVGFTRQSAFTNAFTKYEGISPSRYKKRFYS